MPQKGKVSGSRFKAMMTSGRRKDELFGATAYSLSYLVAFERAGLVLQEDNIVTSAMQWGIDHEDEAIARYEAEAFTKVSGQQEWQQHPKYENVGVTPDGLLGDDGVLEVKCPNTSTHITHLFTRKGLDEYHWQLQGSLWVTGRSYCAFVSYDPRVARDIQIDVVDRDESQIALLEERYLEFEHLVSKALEQLEVGHEL